MNWQVQTTSRLKKTTHPPKIKETNKQKTKKQKQKQKQTKKKQNKTKQNKTKQRQKKKPGKHIHVCALEG